jgi:hypothetical protein
MHLLMGGAASQAERPATPEVDAVGGEAVRSRLRQSAGSTPKHTCESIVRFSNEADVREMAQSPLQVRAHDVQPVL